MKSQMNTARRVYDRNELGALPVPVQNLDTEIEMSRVLLTNDPARKLRFPRTSCAAGVSQTTGFQGSTCSPRHETGVMMRTQVWLIL